MNMFQRVGRREGGFTLIELLTVVAIIGLLTAVIIANISEARKKSRDAKRQSDLRQVEFALEVYREANGMYPKRGCGKTSGWVGPGEDFGGCDEFIDGLKGIIQKLPADPKNTKQGYRYNIASGGAEYSLQAINSVESEIVGITHEFARCDSSCPDSGSCANDGTVYESTWSKKTYAIWHDSNPGNGSGPECW
jgi:general secretion pathway protein G